MIKRIIFDIDNTLLASDKDCDDSYKEYFRDNNLPDMSNELYDVIEAYDATNPSYEMDDMIEYIQKHTEYDFSKKVFDDLFSLYKKHATLLEDDIKETLNKLHEKYELVCLTLWYLDHQTARLETAGIKECFDEVYAIENAGLKPELKAFQTACGPHPFEECLVVGDNLNKDVITPISYGLNAIYYNPNGYETEYESIEKISDLLKRSR